MKNIPALIKALKEHHPDWLTRRIPVGVSKDGRRLDYSSASKEGLVCVGPKGDNAPFHVIEAAWLMWKLRDENRAYFRGPAAGEGGPSRLKIVRFEWVTLAEFLGLKSGVKVA